MKGDDLLSEPYSSDNNNGAQDKSIPDKRQKSLRLQIAQKETDAGFN